MPILTRRRVAGLYLTARLAGLAALPVLALALPAADAVVFGDVLMDPHGAMTLVSHAGDVVRESVWSTIRRLADDGAWQMIDRLIPYSSGASSIGS